MVENQRITLSDKFVWKKAIYLLTKIPLKIDTLDLQIPWNVLKCDKLYLVVYPPPEKEDMCCNICNGSNSNQAQLAKLLGVGDREFRSVNI